MSRGMESNLWKQMRSHLPSNMIATRIENRVGGGIPDVHLLWDGLPFWMELKTTKQHHKNLTSTIAWNYKYSINGGLISSWSSTSFGVTYFYFEEIKVPRLLR